MCLFTAITLKNINPITIATSIIILSILSTNTIYKNLMSRWLPFIIILTFSSGMITLFLYTASLSSNEKTKQKKIVITVLITVSAISSTKVMQNKTTQQIKNFSASTTYPLMIIILILTIITITSITSTPTQTISSSY